MQYILHSAVCRLDAETKLLQCQPQYLNISLQYVHCYSTGAEDSSDVPRHKPTEAFFLRQLTILTENQTQVMLFTYTLALRARNNSS